MTSLSRHIEATEHGRRRKRIDTQSDPRAILLRYLSAVGTACVDRASRKALAHMLHIDTDFRLALAVYDLWRRGFLDLDGDVVTLLTRRTAAPR